MSNIIGQYKKNLKAHTRMIHDNQNEVTLENKQILKINLSFSLLLFPVMFIVTLFVEPERMLWISFFFAFFISLFIYRKMDVAMTQVSVTTLHYINFTLLFLCGVYIGIITGQSNYNVILPVFFAMVPVLIIDTPKKFMLYLLSTFGLTIFLIFFYKGFTALALKDSINCTVFFMIGIFVGSAVTDVRLNNIQFKKDAWLLGNIDFLTKLPNRRRLFETFKDDKAFQGIVMLDIDNFKNYNDTFGHQKGDSALRLFSTCMKAMNLKGMDFYRYGGEEFLAIYKGNSLAEMTATCNYLNENIRQLKVPNSKTEETYLTASIGYYFSNKPIKSELGIHRADVALYHAKKSGKDKSILYQISMEDEALNIPLTCHEN